MQQALSKATIFAPIILFAYRRPTHILKALQALQRNELFERSTLYIFCDGPKNGASEEDKDNIQKTRDIIASRQWTGQMHITYRQENFGLQRSIITGVTDVMNKHGKAIVIEDDIVVSPYFLQYMNDALDVYADEDMVLSIGACNFFATTDHIPETFFIPIPDCWGWATWKNRWDLFEPNAQLLLNQLREKGLIDDFNLGGRFGFESLLIEQIKGTVSSWAIRWQAIAYITGKLSLYPRHAVSQNIGFDSGGTHSGSDKYSLLCKPATKPIHVENLPVEVLPNVLNDMINGYASVNAPSKTHSIKARLKKITKQFVPPILKNVYHRTKKTEASSWWQGNYKNWTEAKQNCTGYDNAVIFDKTLKAIVKVKHGEAAFERDTVVFDKPDFNWPLLTILLKAAVENNNTLSVLDFGGSLGSAYFQNLQMIENVGVLEWSVVEQAHYIEAGNSKVADGRLKFYNTVEDCLTERQPNVLLLSSILSYLENPYEWIKKLTNLHFDYIIVDRTLFIMGGADRLTVQTVPPEIYTASYPCWLFNTSVFIKAFRGNYLMMTDFDPYGDHEIDIAEGAKGFFKGYILKKAKPLTL
jgi:putative methyltransferase (TIGR04325 family)